MPAVIIILLFLKCSPKYNITNYSKAVERFDVTITDNGCALIRTVSSNLYIKYVNSDDWIKLLKNSAYINKKTESSLYRIPKLNIFQIILKNTGKHPLFVKNIKLEYGDNLINALSRDAILIKQKSPAYSIINFKELTSFRRLLSDNYCNKKINFNRNTISYKFKFIAPSDTIIYFAVFPWIPIEYRKYKISFTLKYARMEKIITFAFKKFEYRISGKDFRKPDKDSTE